MVPDRNTSPYSPSFYQEIEEEFEIMVGKTFEEQHKVVIEEMKKKGIIDE